MTKLLSDDEVNLPVAGAPALLSDDEVNTPIRPVSKKKAGDGASIGNWGSAISNAIGEGVFGTQAAIGTFLQAPAANTLSGVIGAAALADRGVTGLMNWASRGSAKVNPGLQDEAQMAAQFAADARAQNTSATDSPLWSPAATIARAGLSLQKDARARTKEVQADNQANNPELVRQQQAISDAEGFLGTLRALKDNPLGFAYTLARSAPDMAAGLGVARLAATNALRGATVAADAAAARVAAAGGDAAAQAAAAKEVIAAAGESAVARAGTAGALAEGTSSALNAREGVYQEVMGLPDAKLAASPRYQEILKTVADPARAREILANELADQAPLLTGAGTLAGSALTRRVFGGDTTAQAVAGVKPLTLRAVGKNTLEEGFEEAVQGVPEDLVQYGAASQADPSKKFDLGGTLAQNIAAGAAMGAGGTGGKYAYERYQDLRGTPGASHAAPTPVASPAAPPAAPANTTTTPPATAPMAPAGSQGSILPDPNAPTAPAAPSTGIDTDLQNRDRSRAASVDQMQRIARAPDYMRLGPSRSPDTGAPMVFAEGDETSAVPPEARGREDVAVMSDGQRVPFQYAVVDASTVNPSNFMDGQVNPGFTDPTPGTLKALSNARTAGVRGAHGLGTASGYITDMEADFGSHGVDPEVIRSMKTPMLVRLYSQGSNTTNMAAKSQGQGLGMAVGELARQDAPMVDASVLSMWQGGDVTAPANRDFVRGFVGKLAGAGQDIADLMSKDGSLSPAGRTRIQAAMAQSAYGDADLIADMFDSTDTDIKGIGEALKMSAPTWANMRDSARSGAIDPNHDITPALLGAVNLVRRARQDRTSLFDLANQVDLTTGQAADPLVQAALRLFYSGQHLTRPMGAARVAGLLDEYSRLAMGTSPDGGLFGDAPAPSDVLSAITKEVTNAPDATQQSQSQSQPTGSGQPNGGGNPGLPAGAGGNTGQRPGNGAGGAQPAANGAGPLAAPNPAGQAPSVAPPAPAPGPTPATPPVHTLAPALSLDSAGAGKTGSFGPILTEYRGDAQGAIQALTELQDGEALAAVSHPDVGDIDLVWGVAGSDEKDGFGLAKISKKHPEVLADLQGFLNRLKKDPVRSGKNRIRLVDTSGRAVVSLDWKGDRKVWLLTAYEESGAGAGTTMDTASINPGDDTARPGTNPTETLAQTPSSVAVPAPNKPANTIFTEDMAAAARARLKAKLGRLNSGLDPETMLDGLTLAGYHIEGGSRKFGAFARAMVADLGDAVKPYLMSWYLAIRNDPRASGFKADMDKASVVEDADIEVLLAKQDGPARSAQFASYDKYIDENAQVPVGVIEQINMDDRLEDGEAEILMAKAKAKNAGAAASPTEDNTLPPGWTEATPGGMATNPDPVTGGIVDQRIGMVKGQSTRGQWFAVPHGYGKTLTGFDSRAQALAALQAAIKPKPAPKGTAPSLQNPAGRRALAQLLADHFIGGEGFKTIVQARAFIADATGDKVEPGTDAAKLADETIELAVVMAARDIVQSGRKQGRDDQVIYDRLVGLYERQPTLGVRSSTSVREQAYSTPAPLAFIASRLAGIKAGDKVGEPTGGNTMLLLEVDPKNAVVNELNQNRADAARSLGFEVTQNNAADTPLAPAKSLDATVMNPPFGAVKNDAGDTIVWAVAPNYGTREIDHAIAFKALDAMKDDGRAVMIVGGVDASTEDQIREGYRGRSKREFYFRLYQNYKVVDHFTVDGGLYSKQGAAYPVDVVVIEGRGRSERALPAANLPKRYDTWAAIKEKLNENTGMEASGRTGRPGRGTGAPGRTDGSGMVDGTGRAGNPAGDGRTGPGSSQPGSVTGAGNAGNRGPGAGGRGPGSTQPAPENGTQPAGSGVQRPIPSQGVGGVQADAPADRGRGPVDVGGPGGGRVEPAQPGLTDRRGQEQETSSQVGYEPRSGAAAVGTLVPMAMRQAIQESLDRVQAEVGNLDAYVGKQLAYSPEQVAGYFSAEQVDALALAIFNAEKNAGFIIGDQTGVGKGRVVAAMIRYALQKGKIPIFVTEKPNLYADMIRDLDDIGMAQEMGLESAKSAIFMTNTAEAIPYVLIRKVGDTMVEREFSLKAAAGDKRLQELMGEMAASRDLGSYKVVFTTYNQLQTVKGKVTARMRFVSSLADGGYVIFDESHNAGGTSMTESRGKKKSGDAEQDEGSAQGRAGFVRAMVRSSAGSFFSSATYAKRPDVMDLYSSTNMMLAVPRPADLAAAIMAGGVPMQQIVATMLTVDGQYIRRERTFAGVSYETRPMTVDKATADNMATAMRMVLAFSRAKEAAVKEIKKDADREGSVVLQNGGEKTAVASANFGAIMHNLIDQMLLALKVKDSADFAIERLRAGEKVVLTVSNTMGSFLEEYARDMGLRPGDPVSMSFADLYLRYLEKQRDITIKRPGGGQEKYRLTDQDLGPQLVEMFEKTSQFIEGAGFGDAPVSPIDYLHDRLRKAGFKTGEITGRTIALDYSQGFPVLATRKAKIAQRLEAMRGFNGGALDAMILNQSGSTGLSLHASAKFKDQRQRRMIIVQAEKNIDTHMQMLGRIHRTGQVVTPNYTQAMADIPAEMRPAAVLLKKMASLSANTTANRNSSMSAEGLVDFMNDYGGQVAVEFLLDNPEIHRALGGTERLALPNESTEANEELIRKLTGYIPILTIAQQETVYEDLMERYKELLERENAMGTNKLEARAVDLKAVTLSSAKITPDQEGKDQNSEFAKPAYMEQVDVARVVKPMTSAEVDAAVKDGLGGKTPDQYRAGLMNMLRNGVQAYTEETRAKMVAAGADPVRVTREAEQIQMQRSVVESILVSYQIGDSVTLLDAEQTPTYAVVTAMVHTGKTKNPAAGSAWKVTLALANGEARSITLTANQLGKSFTLRKESGQVQTSNPNQPGELGYYRVRDLFDLYSSGNSRREKRWMVTGNLLAGFALYPGQIVNYTLADGSVATGALMRRNFDFAKAQEKAGSIFGSPTLALKFFREAGPDSVLSTTDDGQLRVKFLGGDSWEFTVSSSKRAGGTYFLDKGLTNALGTDFYKAGGVMRARTGGDEAAAALDHLLLARDDVKLQAVTHADVARKVLGLDQGGDNIAREERAVYQINEPKDSYDVPYDLFPETQTDLQPTLPGPAGRAVRAPAGKAKAGRSLDLQPTPTVSVRQDPAMPGVYHISSQLVSVGTRDLPVQRVTNWMEAASALAAMGRYAVEHFDVLITDKAGKPLAVVGAFKGAVTQASVYPAVIMSEALRIEGAARAWGVHNHPSGTQTLSSADLNLSAVLERTFSPSSVQWMGVAAIGDGRYEASDPMGTSRSEGILMLGKTIHSVPVVERTITRATGPINSLTNAKQAVDTVKAIGKGLPGILFLNAQNGVSAWVPVEPGQMAELRKDERFDKLVNSAAEASATGAIIANPGGVLSQRVLGNMRGALELADVRLLDVVDISLLGARASAAENGGLPKGNNVVLSRAATAGTGMAMDDLQAVADRVKAAMPNMPDVVVLADPSGAPTALQDYIDQQGARGDVEGAMHAGKFYLFASGLSDELRAEHVLAQHEAAHYGLRAVLGSNLRPAMNLIYAQNANVRKAATELQKRGKLSNAEATEEVIVDLPDSELTTLKGWRGVVMAARDWLASHGFTRMAAKLDGWLVGSLSDQERADLMVAGLVRSARDYVRGKRAGQRPDMPGDTRLAGMLADDMVKQQQWLNVEARARGFADIDVLRSKDAGLFDRLVTLWRGKNPDSPSLSRGTSTKAAFEARIDALFAGESANSFGVKILDKSDMLDMLGLGAGPVHLVEGKVTAGAVNHPAMTADVWKKVPQWLENPAAVFGSDTQPGRLVFFAPELVGGSPVRMIVDPRPDGRGVSLLINTYDAKASPFVRWTNDGLLRYFDRQKATPVTGSFQPRLTGLPGDWGRGEILTEKNLAGYRRAQQETGGESGTMLSRAAPPAPPAPPAPAQTVYQRAEAIIQDRVGSGQGRLDRLAQTVTRATGIEALMGKLAAVPLMAHRRLATIPGYSDMAQRVAAGVVSDYGVPESVIDQRALLQGRQRVRLRRSGELVDKLASLTREESRVAYEWMNMDGSDPRAYLSMMQGLPEESVKVLQDIQKMIDALSQDAVRMGQLDPRSYERNKFAYLRRTYEKHMADMTPGQRRARQRATQILGDQYRGRGITEPVLMDKLKQADPDWWQRKVVAGKGDTGLVNQKFIRLERLAPSGVGTVPLPGMTGKAPGRVLEVAYWPAEKALPAKYKEWRQNGVFEVRDVKGPNVVLWRDFTKDEREAMGEVDEARFAIANTLQRMIHDVETGRYFEWLAFNEAKKEGETIDGTVVDPSETRWHRAFVPGEWVRVPDTKVTGTSVPKYGLLAGRYLPGPIWNDVRQMANGSFAPLGETYAEVLRLWKTAKTALSPAVHTNNILANMVMADWHDVSAGHVLKALKIALAAGESQGRGVLGTISNVAQQRGGLDDRAAAAEVLNRYRDSGGDIGSWATQEVARKQLEPLLAAVEAELGRSGAAGANTTAADVGVMTALQHMLRLRFPSAWDAFKGSKPAKRVGLEASTMIDLYQAEDDIFRLAAWLRAKEDGQTDMRAGRDARRSFLDYDINAPWIEAMRRSAWPFIAFTYRAAPMLAEIATKKPHKILKLMALAGLVNYLGVLMGGGGDDDERRLLPEEKAGRVWGLVPKLIRMPWNSDQIKNGVKVGESPVYLDIRRWIPVGDIVDTDQNHAALPLPPGLIPGGPLAVLGELFANKSAFTGKAITLETDTKAEAAGKVFDHLYKAFMPNLLGVPGTYATSGVYDAYHGRTDAFGREQSVAQAVASSVGVKLGSYPADVLRKNLISKAEAEQAEIGRVISGLKRQRQTNQIDADEYRKMVIQQQDKIRKIDEELREKIRP